MDAAELEKVIDALRADPVSPQVTELIDTVHNSTDATNLPRLVALLDDESFFIREVVAWPVSELAGLDALPDLLRAFHRDLADGHDSDGIAAAIVDLVEANSDEVKPTLARMKESENQSEREDAEWLAEFCQ